MRLTILTCGVLAVLCSIPNTLHANCPGGTQRFLVSQPPEVVFTAGVAETKYVPVIWLSMFGDDTDCGAMAYTALPGITIQKNYCTWSDPPGSPGGCPFENPAWVASDSGGSSNLYYQWYLPDHLRKIAVHYDGSTPAGTRGTINLHNPLIQMSYPPELGEYYGSIPVAIESSAATSPWFTVTSSASNISGDSLIIDNPRMNGSPSLQVFITHVYNGTNWPHPVAVTYDGNIAKWKIRNEDGTAMPASLSFHVHFDWTAVRLQTGMFASASSILINAVRSNENPRATILVTANTTGTRRLLHPLQVYYSAPYWYVQTSDGQLFPGSDKFGNTVGVFVKVISVSRYMDDLMMGDAGGIAGPGDDSNGAGVDIRAISPRKNGNYKVLNKFCFTTGSTSALGRPIIITKNQTPLGVYTSQPTSNNYWGVWRVGFALNGYTSTVYSESGEAMPDVLGFNVWGPYAAQCPPAYP